MAPKKAFSYLLSHLCLLCLLCPATAAAAAAAAAAIGIRMNSASSAHYITAAVAADQRHRGVARSGNTWGLAARAFAPDLRVLCPCVPLICRDFDIHIIAEETIWRVGVGICTHSGREQQHAYCTGKSRVHNIIICVAL